MNAEPIALGLLGILVGCGLIGWGVHTYTFSGPPNDLRTFVLGIGITLAGGAVLAAAIAGVIISIGCVLGSCGLKCPTGTNNSVGDGDKISLPPSHYERVTDEEKSPNG